MSAANAKLSATLGTLSARVRELQGEKALTQVRVKVGDSVANGRQALATVRESAYPASSRSCAGVQAGAAKAASAARSAASNSGQSASAAKALAEREAAVAASRTAVAKDLAALRATLATSSGIPTISEKDVEAALAAAATAISDSKASRATLGQEITSGVAQAREFSTSAQRIAAKVC